MFRAHPVRAVPPVRDVPPDQTRATAIECLMEKGVGADEAARVTARLTLYRTSPKAIHLKDLKGRTHRSWTRWLAAVLPDVRMVLAE